MMRKPLLIGDNMFLTKKEALAYYKQILNSYSFGESLNDEDYDKVFGLIQYDMSFSEECSCTDTDDSLEDDVESGNDENTENVENTDLFIEDIKVSKVQFGAKCFEVFFSDETSYYISYIMMISQRTSSASAVFNRACRNAIQPDMRVIKQQYFEKNSVNGYVKCQESNILSKWEELAIDHRQPNTFSVIVDRFKEVNGIDVDQIKYSTDASNNLIFEDEALVLKFRNYHKEKANLRIVRKELNLSRSGLARITRSNKDLFVE